MNAMPETARPQKMCQLRSFSRLLDHPKATKETDANTYRMAEMSETLQICQFCTSKALLSEEGPEPTL